MRYRIRYEQGAERRTTEVEANSPNEAVVKFQCVRARQPRRRGPARVTSVCVVDMGDDDIPEPAW